MGVKMAAADQLFVAHHQQAIRRARHVHFGKGGGGDEKAGEGGKGFHLDLGKMTE